MATKVNYSSEIQRGAASTDDRRLTWRRHSSRALLAIMTMLGGLILTAGTAAADHHGIAPAPVTCAEQIRPVLRSPSTHSCVASLQHFLNAIAFIASDPKLNPGSIDAHFGSGTQNAVRRLQELKGLSQDGVVGSHTWGSIAGDCAIWYTLGVYNICHTQIRY